MIDGFTTICSYSSCCCFSGDLKGSSEVLQLHWAASHTGMDGTVESLFSLL